MGGHFDYKGFRIYESRSVWTVQNIERQEYAVGEVVAKLSKALWPGKEDVKTYIDTFLI